MKRTKQLAFAIALVFVAGSFWSAQAQVISNSRGTKLQGIEVSPGIEDAERGVVNGASYLGKTSGTFAGSFFMSLSYDKTSSASLPPIPDVNKIRIGTWSLPVYRSNQYLGAIYGRVVEGAMQWNDDRSIATVNITLSVDGGTQTFADANGKGTFVGKLNRATKGKPTMNGMLTIEF